MDPANSTAPYDSSITNAMDDDTSLRTYYGKTSAVLVIDFGTLEGTHQGVESSKNGDSKQ